MADWQSLVAEAFKEWSVKTMGRDFLLNLVAGALASIAVFLVARQWPLIRSHLSRDAAAFRRLFGPGAIRSGEVFVTLDVYQDIQLLPADLQRRLGAVVAAPPASGAPVPAEPAPPTVPPVEEAVPAAAAAPAEAVDQAQAANQAEADRVEQAAKAALASGNRYFKVFPDGHITAFLGASEGLLGYCSARAAGYLIDTLSRIPKVAARIRAVSDREMETRWDGTFINLGSSYSNIKTDDIKHMHDGSWFRDDNGVFTLNEGPVQQEKARSRKGIVVKRDNPHSPGHTLLVCAGLGEWGTSGAAWFLARNWKRLSRRFGSRPFLIVVSVIPQADDTAREILFIGEESTRYRVCRWLRAMWTRRNQKA